MDPPWQVHRYRDDPVIMRQRKDVTYEAPFTVLLFGTERALLLDTSAVDDDLLQRIVDRAHRRVVDQPPVGGNQLVVVHTHGHGDHVAGDPSFVARPDTLVVGKTVQDVQAFFGFTEWPGQVCD